MFARVIVLLTAFLAIGGCRAAVRNHEWPKPAALTERLPGQSDEALYGEALRLQRAGMHLESVPYFRAAVVLHPEVAQLHVEYGQSLHNAAIETDLSHGFVRFVVSNSLDRAALVREALVEMRRAVELASDPGERAYALFILARTESMLGLPADALLHLRQSQALGPGIPLLVEQIRAAELEMGAPVPSRSVGAAQPAP